MTRLAGGMQSQFHNTSYHECEGGIEKSVPWDHHLSSVTQQALLVILNGDPLGGFFYPILAKKMDSFPTQFHQSKK